MSLKKSVFKNSKKLMASDERFGQLTLWMVNLCLNSYTFCLYFILYLHNFTDSDPQHWNERLLLKKFARVDG